MNGTEASGGDQLSLLHGFVATSANHAGEALAAENPVAQVVLESSLAHLDRVFDYAVPRDLDARARVGVRVKVPFAGRAHTGYLVARIPVSTRSASLLALTQVISEQPVLALEILQLARALAERLAGTVSDVLRVAVPPRAARVDKEFPAHADAGAQQPPGSPVADLTGAGERFGRYVHGEAFLKHLAAGGSPRAVLASLGGYGPRGWPQELTDAVCAVVASGRGAVVVVPDQRDLARVEAALVSRLGTQDVARLTAEDGPTPRYRNFLRLRLGHARVAVGTRSAAYAPVRNLGLVCLWDDGDDQHAEQRAPYPHSRDVLLLRAEQEDAALLLASTGRSTEAQRLVDTGWAQSIHADRRETRDSVARVLHTADAYERAHDPLAAQARIPHAAWKAAQEGLRRGPVLIQVARTGYSPSTACEECRQPARCSACTGPLARGSRAGAPECRWCGRIEPRWRCVACGGVKIRATVSGANRTAEELGRAFPGVPVISSAGTHIVDEVSDDAQVVVATPGAEPVPQSGYAAVVLLDGTAMLRRESLRAAEDTLRRWFAAAVLARPAALGGLVVVTADDDVAVGNLVRWDPRGAAERELALRHDLGLPPAVRYAALTGSREALNAFLEGIDTGVFLRVVGPVVVAGQAGQPGAQATNPAPSGEPIIAEIHRTLVFFSYRDAARAVSSLKARRTVLSAKRTSEPVQIRCDAPGLL